MDISQFRQDFPEFSDAAVYPDSQVNLWLRAAANFVNADAWGEMADLGIELFAAHNITLAAANSRAAASGQGATGGMSGAVSSKSVGDASISYDTSSGTEDGAGNYNLTSYGKQFFSYAKMFGAGVVQL